MAGSASRISISTGKFARLDDAAGKVIHVMRGRLWITQEKEGLDHLVEAGDSFTIAAHGLTLVGALRPSVFHVCEPCVAPSGAAALAAFA